MCRRVVRVRNYRNRNRRRSLDPGRRAQASKGAPPPATFRARAVSVPRPPRAPAAVQAARAPAEGVEGGEGVGKRGSARARVRSVSLKQAGGTSAARGGSAAPRSAPR
eukprot:6088337-Prymnesium_polylepis.1